MPPGSGMNPNDFIGAQFGFDVAIHGTQAVVGTFYDNINNKGGYAFAVDISGTNLQAPTQLGNQSITENKGSSVAVNGTYIAVGAPNFGNNSTAGSVYIYKHKKSLP